MLICWLRILRVLESALGFGGKVRLRIIIYEEARGVSRFVTLSPFEKVFEKQVNHACQTSRNLLSQPQYPQSKANQFNSSTAAHHNTITRCRKKNIYYQHCNIPNKKKVYVQLTTFIL